MVGCGLTDKGGLGESVPLGDSDAIDSGVFDTAHDDFGTPSDANADTSDHDGDVAIDGDGRADADAGCPPLAETDACKGIPKLLSIQIVDGDDGDFGCVPTTTFTLTSAATTAPKPPPALPEKVHMRAAWTVNGLAVHVRVEDPTIVVADAADPNIYDGDAVEVFVSGFPTLTGTFDGTADAGAMQIIVAPSSGGTPARAKIYQNGDRGPLDVADYATEITIDGYTVELALPWALLRGAGTVGGKVGLDLAVDVEDDPTATTRPAVWAVWKQLAFTGKTSCAGSPPVAFAWCDDRVWCTPALE
jgi:hypothetical protein